MFKKLNLKAVSLLNLAQNLNKLINTILRNKIRVQLN